MIRHHSFVSVISAFGIFMALAPAAFGQGTGGTISGTVTDPAQAPVPGSHVSITNQAKGETRTVTTNDQGFYSVPNVPPGQYEVMVSASGFATAVQKNLLIEVGQEAVANIQLKVGDLSEKVEIKTDATIVNTTSSTLSNVVSERVVRDLPLNGRDWTQLAALEPGVHTIDAQNQITVNSSARSSRGWGTEMSFGGNRPQQNNYRVDGVSINDYSGGGPGGVLGSVFGVEAIGEFSVVTGNASADYGKTSGGVINAITRSGTNQIHGSAFEFLRNSALDARNFFDRCPSIDPNCKDGGRPPFKRNQFGFAVGGPVYLPRFGEGGPTIGYRGKNRTFFFANYEGLRQSLSTTSLLVVPSRAARMGHLTAGNVTVDSKVVPYLALYPLPNGVERGDVGDLFLVTNAIASENFLTGRIDHKISDADDLHATFQNDNSEASGGDSFNFSLLGQKSRRNLVSVEYSHIFTPNAINFARVGYSRSVSNSPIPKSPIDPRAADTSLGFLQGRPLGNFTTGGGITQFPGGLGAQAEFDYHYNSYQVYDDLFYTRAAHSLKFGAAVERVQSNQAATLSPQGLFAFGSLQGFLTNRPQSFSSLIPGVAAPIYLRQTIVGVYAQDDFRVRPNFTLNLGLRYEPATVPAEKYNHLATLLSLTDATPKLGAPYFQNPTLRNFSPRVGFAWDPFRDGKTAIRGGFGIYDILPLTYQFELLVVNTAPFTQSGALTTLPAGSFPTGAFSLLTANDLRYSYVQPNPKRAYVEQWNLNIQRQLPGNILLHVGYVGQHGLHHVLRTNDANIVLPTQTAQGLFWPTPKGSGARLNSRVGTILALAWEGYNIYHAGNVNVSRRQKGLTLGASYSWSKSIDNASSSIAGSNFNNSLVGPLLSFPQFMRGLSDFDVRHHFVFNYLWEIPRPKSAEGVIKWATGGWQLGGIFRASSGLPFTPVIGGDSLGMLGAAPFNYPDRVNSPECANPVNPGNADHYIKTECFVVPQADLPISQRTRLGNSGRNIAIGPGVTNLDLSLFKNNHINIGNSERFNIQFRADVFNVLNHPNFAVPDRTVAQLYNASFVASSSAGVLNSTATTSRQLQFALKLIW